MRPAETARQFGRRTCSTESVGTRDFRLLTPVVGASEALVRIVIGLPRVMLVCPVREREFPLSEVSANPTPRCPPSEARSSWRSRAYWSGGGAMGRLRVGNGVVCGRGRRWRPLRIVCRRRTAASNGQPDVEVIGGHFIFADES